MDLYFWKWTLGEPYYKSARIEQKENQNNEVQIIDTQLNAINQSLSNDLIIDDFGTSDFTSSNKREELDNRVSSRELVQQCGANPFLTSQSSYVNDIVTRDMFLKPINTSQDKVKSDE
jgi:hypothetical protein